MLNNMLVALFHAITMNGDWGFQGQKGAKYHKIAPQDSITIFQVF